LFRLPKRRTPTHPHRDIDAFATADRLIAISRETSFPWNNSTALIKLVHENPSTSFAAQPCGPRLRLPCLSQSASFFDMYHSQAVDHAMTRVNISTSVSGIFYASQDTGLEHTAAFASDHWHLIDERSQYS
jgi:hypothetical protein